MLKQKKTNDLEADLYPVETVKEKDVKTWPAIVILSFLFVIVILGFVGWDTKFKMETFTNFHKWLTELTIGEDFAIFSYILGGGALAFGKFEIATLITIVLVVTGVVALMNRMALKDFADSYGEGFAKMLKPVCLYVLTYVLFMISYMTPFMAAATDWAMGLTKEFNPFIMTITGFVTSIFHADLGYTAYVVGSALSTNFAGNFDLAHTLYVATYGLAGLALPTGSLLLVGLSYLKIDYKSWFKYIWMFAVAMIAIIFILGAIITYAL
jgi:uncharacterized ion transporter superfamily protein YfcC